MSIHVFGNTVEEVQRKLSEILPLTDAGAERLQQVHQQLQAELGEYRSGYEQLEKTVETLSADASTLDGEMRAVRSEVVTAVEAMTGDIDQVVEQSDEALAQLSSAREQVDSQIDGLSEQLQTSATASESELQTLISAADSMHTQVTTVRDQSQVAYGSVDERVNEFTTRWQQGEAKSQERFSGLKSSVAETHTPEVKQKFDGFNTSTVETVSNVVNLLQEKDGGLGEFFSAFDTDAKTLADDFQTRTRQVFGELRTCAEDECGKVVEESLEHLAKEVVEAFAAEIIASAATTQLGATTTGMLSVIIPELVVVKKITSVINGIL